MSFKDKEVQKRTLMIVKTIDMDISLATCRHTFDFLLIHHLLQYTADESHLCSSWFDSTFLGVK
jgi:hypothetical protein